MIGWQKALNSVNDNSNLAIKLVVRWVSGATEYMK